MRRQGEANEGWQTAGKRGGGIARILVNTPASQRNRPRLFSKSSEETNDEGGEIRRKNVETEEETRTERNIEWYEAEDTQRNPEEEEGRTRTEEEGVGREETERDGKDYGHINTS